MTEEFARYLSDVVAGRITLAEFQDWFIDYVMGPDAVPPDDVAIAGDIENAMAEYTGGHISEAAFREFLQKHLEESPIISYLLDPAAPCRWSSAANRTLRIEPIVVNG